MKHLTRALFLLLLFTGFSAATALAQDDQAYKKEYNAALDAYKAKKVNDAYNHWLKAAELAGPAGDAEIKEKSLNYVSQLDYSRGLNALKQEQYQQALSHFEKGIQHDASVAKNHYGRGLALKNLDRWEEALAAYKTAIDSGDRKVADLAKQSVRDQYIFLASSALSSSGENISRSAAQEAISHLTAMQEHVEADADAFYYLAEAYKALGDYDKSVAAADQGLELHRGSRTDKAKLYFVKGEALMLNGSIAEAKSAFQEARYGNFKAPAEHYIETL